MSGLVERQLRQRRPGCAELGKPGLQRHLPGLRPLQGNTQPEDIVGQRPNPVRLVAKYPELCTELNVLVELPTYGVLVGLRRLRLPGLPFVQPGDLSLL